jgi:cytidylate kinase|tara:strand:+ start:212 stop:868 length:657 start_codon:yes stop_codon:yes gene_type:complete
MNKQISIDGPAASGKTSIGKQVSSQLKWHFLDTGLMYRAATWIVIKNKIDFSNESDILLAVKNSDFSISSNYTENSLIINGQNVITELRTDLIDKYVSQISKITEVREILVDQQREIGKSGNIVMVGRDIGSVVLPNANTKIYLDASLEVRSKRRFDEMKKNGGLTFEEVEKDLANRDTIDSQRKNSPLIIPENSTLINTDSMTMPEVVKKILSVVGI